MKIVILTSRFPWPIEKGDKLRIYHQIKYLAKHHSLMLISIVDEIPPTDSIKELEKYCERIEYFSIPKWQRYTSTILHWLNGKPGQVGYFYSSSVKRKIYQSIIAYQPDRIYCQLIRVSEYVKTLPFVKVLDYMDTFSSGMSRQADVRPFPHSIFYRREAKLTQQYEHRVYSYFDETTIISERDKNELPMLSKNLVHVIANGIDSEFFTPSSAEKKYDLVFVGNLGYKPNEEAVLKLLEWYREANFEQTLNVLIAGARPTEAILAIEEEGWHIAGWVDDIRDAYQNAKVFAAPLMIGSGLQNKILEAMSCGLPCVTTSLVNDSIGAKQGEEICIADDLDAWKTSVIDLLQNDEKAKTIGENARTFVLNNYQWTGFNSKLEQIITHAKSKAHIAG